MNKLILIILLIGLVTPMQQKDTEYPPIVDGVYVGDNVPNSGTICEEAGVYGDPYGLTEPYYFLQVGDYVHLGELSKGVTGWIEVGLAQWIEIKKLCLKGND